MLLDPSSGTIFLYGDIVISPQLSEREFLRSPLGKASLVLVNNPPVTSYLLPAGTRGTLRVGSDLYFNREQIKSVRLALHKEHYLRLPLDQFRTPEVQREVKADHDALLAQELGPPPYEYWWGTVGSGYDDRSVSSSIWVRYRI